MSTLVRAAFLDQAKWCDQLGSPFTSRICRLCAERLRKSLPVAQYILDWPGDPSVKADSVPLRVAGALHYLARSGQTPKLRAQYPPNASDDDHLWSAINAALHDHADVVRRYLSSPPQTNEVMRSAALLPGLLEIAQRTGLPLHLYELGASAGLNLILDRYRYQFGDTIWGDAASPVKISPQWQGSAPPSHAPLDIRSRRGVDLHPIDLHDHEARERLLSYIWPDQSERLQRLDAAVSLWLRDPPLVERADAAQWLERSGITRAAAGTTRVLFHSISWSYFSETTQQRITQLMGNLGEHASDQAPLAWLRFELSTPAAELRLKLWPAGGDVSLATGHPHGATIQWLGESPAAAVP